VDFCGALHAPSRNKHSILKCEGAVSAPLH
jgi:hypothetical protein